MRGLVLAIALAAALAACTDDAADGGGSYDVVAIESPAGAGSSAPHLALTVDGRAVMSWLEDAGDGRHALKFATLDADRWSAPAVLAESADWFINWADFPSVVPLTASDWAAHWLAKQPGGVYAYDVAVSLSADGGRRWSAPVTPHRDGTLTEHGFVSLFPWQGGVGVVWLDGRNTAADQAAGADSEAAGRKGGMTLRFARLDRDGSLHEEAEIDARVCDCCQTAATVADGAPVVAYRDRTEGEIRDIVVTRRGPAGWAAPTPVGSDQWLIPACPVNGPAIAARGEQVVVAWYTSPKSQARVQLVRSTDGGRSFGAPVPIETGPNTGRVDVVLTADGTAVVSWLAKSAEVQGQGQTGGEIRLREVSRDGVAGPVSVVARTSSARAAGFPKMVDTPAGLVFAWTEPGEPSRVRTARARKAGR